MEVDPSGCPPPMRFAAPCLAFGWRWVGVVGDSITVVVAIVGVNEGVLFDDKEQDCQGDDFFY
ncbi:hypothetical protein L484_018795 [Morus notabilis]|uniref:Uncharacterized protein n=1 Tax=Morus notabilis TaxID=981085 RepID=W9R4C7_9ROSA|nr:hypothetical protein L484_018795 [Morus notabilis]